MPRLSLEHKVDTESGELRESVRVLLLSPAARKASYLRPVDALRLRYITPHIGVPDITTASFIVVGKPQPRVEDALRIGELMRMAVMSQAKRVCGEDKVPSIFSGHDMPEGNRHRHAFYLPWDNNRDGHIDRILMHVPEGMQAEARQIVEGVKKLWCRDGGEWNLVLESIGLPDPTTGLTGESSRWQSVTPYLHPWYRKKNFQIEDQIRRECRERGLPEPASLESFDEVEVAKNRKRRPVHFHRFRQKRGLTQPDTRGSFWRLTFPEPVTGPLALGFGCHYGLGLFQVENKHRVRAIGSSQISGRKHHEQAE